MFESPLNLESEVSAVPGLTLDNTDLYSKTTKFGPSDKYYSLGYFRNAAFDEGEYAVAKETMRVPYIGGGQIH